MPCPFIGPKMFRAGPNFFSNPKSLFTYFASHKHFVPDKKMICIQQNCFLCQHKCSQIFGLAQKIWTGTKHFGTCKRTGHNNFLFTLSLEEFNNISTFLLKQAITRIQGLMFKTMDQKSKQGWNLHHFVDQKFKQGWNLDRFVIR
jgi:hypothetical protein